MMLGLKRSECVGVSIRVVSFDVEQARFRVCQFRVDYDGRKYSRNAVRGKFNTAMFVAVDFGSHADKRDPCQLVIQRGHVRNAPLQSVECS